MEAPGQHHGMIRESSHDCVHLWALGLLVLWASSFCFCRLFCLAQSLVFSLRYGKDMKPLQPSTQWPPSLLRSSSTSSSPSSLISSQRFRLMLSLDRNNRSRQDARKQILRLVQSSRAAEGAGRDHLHLCPAPGLSKAGWRHGAMHLVPDVPSIRGQSHDG